MSERDLKRIEVLSEVLAGRRTVAAAAAVLAVSERQAYRLLARYGDGVEQRGEPCTLLVFIDDATSRLMQLRFVLSESTDSYFARYTHRVAISNHRLLSVSHSIRTKLTSSSSLLKGVTGCKQHRCP
jgi:hypothetical protein